jgi:hypothetical protein
MTWRWVKMRRNTLPYCLISLAIALLAALPVEAQLARLVGPEQELFLYDGDLQLDSGGIAVSSWGSGTAESVYEASYVGPEVLKVSSQGPYQGIVLHFSRPPDLAEFLNSDAGYLDLRLLPAQAPWDTAQARERARERLGRGGRTAGRTARGGGMRGGGMGGGRGGGMRGGGMGGGRGGGMRGGGMGGGRGGGMRGGGMGGGMRGGGMRGGRGGGMRGGGMGGGRGGGMRGGRQTVGGGRAGMRPAAGAPGADEEKAFSMDNLRLVLFTDRGMGIADQVPVGVLSNDERGWTPVAVPLAQFQGVSEAANLRAIGVFADRSDVFYLGRARLIVDRSPVDITVKADPLITAPDQVIDFSVELRGGPITPRVSWDFDDADGIQEQALGPKVKYLYKTPGDFLATCTVTDSSGVRPPLAKAIGIRIETPG